VEGSGGVSGRLWKVLRRLRRLWKVLGRLRRLWKVLGRLRRLWKVLGRFWTSGDCSCCWWSYSFGSGRCPVLPILRFSLKTEGFCCQRFLESRILEEI